MLCFGCHKKNVNLMALSVMTRYVCKKCGKPSTSGSSHIPGSMCPTCSVSERLCEECGNPAVDYKWLPIVDSWGEKNTVVIYHEDCQDGFGAAYSAWKKFQNGAAYVPLSYDEIVETALLAGKDVYVLDFSFKKEIYDELERSGTKVVTIDHHKSAEKVLCGMPNAIFDGTKSGCVLAHEYFHPRKKVPKMLKMIEDRDLWKFEMEGTEELYQTLRNEGYSFLSWEYWESHIPKSVKDGAEYLRIFNERVLELSETAEPCEINGVRGLAVRVGNGDYVSELGNVLAKRSGTFALVSRLKNGLVKCSLRSVEDFDASAIAESFGGGGHKNSCSFTVTKDVYESFLIK